MAALDLGKASLTACVRIPHPAKPGRRCQEVREYRTTTASLLALAGDLRGHGVTLVAMEATSDYWKPVFYLLEAEGFTCWLLNARHVKNVPGLPKTDKLDAVWLAKVVERGMCTPSLGCSPATSAACATWTRYRRTLIRERTAEKQRVEKLLEDAQIKLSSVVGDIFGMSGRAMLRGLHRSPANGYPAVLARSWPSSPDARQAHRCSGEALTGHFGDHHAFLCQMMPGPHRSITQRAAELTTRIEEQIAPFAEAADRLDVNPGVGRTGAQELIAEIGVDMTRFPDAAHLVSWAKFAPIDKNSTGKKKNASTGKGNPWLGATIEEIVSGAARRDTSSPSATSASPAAEENAAPSSPSGTPS